MSEIVMTPNPDWAEITTIDIRGSGLFDNLMAAVKEHLQEEYNSQRIRGADYSRVYMESLQAVLANTIQYITANALVEEQKAKIAAEINKINAEIALISKQSELTEQERAKAAYEVTYLYPANIALTNARTATEVKQTALAVKQTELLDKQIWGFSRNAELNVAKLAVDAWMAARATDDEFPVPTYLTDDNISAIMWKVYSSLEIGIPD